MGVVLEMLPQLLELVGEDGDSAIAERFLEGSDEPVGAAASEGDGDDALRATSQNA
jgi:hypothetical protein